MSSCYPLRQFIVIINHRHVLFVLSHVKERIIRWDMDDVRLTRAHTTRSRTIKKKARDTEKERVREREYECMNRDVALSNRTNVPGREGERHSSFVLFYLPCFRVKMKGKGGGCFFVVVGREKKISKKKRSSTCSFSIFLSSFRETHDTFFNTLNRSRARELKRERERGREREYIYTHTYRIYSYVIFCVIFTVFRRAQQ